MQILADAATTPPIITPEGAERRVLSYGGSLMLVQFTFGPGVVAPIHSHPHEQVGYVVSGEIDLLMEGQPTMRLGAGCSYYVPPNLRHGVVTYAPTVLLDAFTPLREDFMDSLVSPARN
jgi:quercetin dioxygenase-like cupin family protein